MTLIVMDNGMTTTLDLIDGDIHDNYIASNWWWYPWQLLWF